MSNLISRREAWKRFHARGFSIAASKELVEKLPKYTDGKRKKVREADLDQEIEKLLEPMPVTPRKRVLSERNIRAIFGPR